MTPKEVRKLWIEALESGKYRQGERRLKKIVNGEVRHCCLGVLCEVVIDNGLAGGFEWKPDTSESYPLFFLEACDGDRHGAALPKSIAVIAGLRSVFGDYGSDDSLAIVNDRSGDFTKVIEIIKSEPEGLFVDEPAEVAGG